MKWVGALFLYIYRLPLWKLTVLLLLSTALFLGIRHLWGRKPLLKWLLAFLLLAWAGLVLYTTVLQRPNSRAFLPQSLFQSYRDLMNGGNPELLRSNFMNGVLFYPAGLLLGALLPEKLSKGYRILLPFFLLILFSSGIELIQYRFSLGMAECDDVLHNGLGGLFGALCAMICVKKDRS